jgi:hypothetical protein
MGVTESGLVMDRDRVSRIHPPVEGAQNRTGPAVSHPTN